MKTKAENDSITAITSNILTSISVLIYSFNIKIGYKRNPRNDKILK
jgi:hypothetical protein